MIKFRTMYSGAEKDREKYLSLSSSPFPTFKIKNDPRFVGIGAWLSHAGLDELPQLINIIKGEMSFIGPRPFPLDESKQIPKKWQFRFHCKPGLLSSWAISARDKMTTTQWTKLDQLDFANDSLVYELKIITTMILYHIKEICQYFKL